MSIKRGSISNKDVRRVLLLRHGERLDHLEEQWYKRLEENKSNHLNWPHKLPTFAKDKNVSGLDMENDSPLTLLGVNLSELIGGYLAKSGFRMTNVISSPAFRCVSTAHHIIQGYNKVASEQLNLPEGVCLEPGWYEWGFEQCILLPNFIDAKTMKEQLSYNVSEQYQPIVNAREVNPMETHQEFQDRMKLVVTSTLEKLKGTPSPQVMIVTHAPCMDSLRHVTKAPVRGYSSWNRLITRMPYLGMILWEEDPKEGWTIIPPPVDCFAYVGNPFMDMDAYLQGFPSPNDK